MFIHISAHKKQEKRCIINVSPTFKILLVAGLEPARCCHRGILSPLRLPIPPHQHRQLKNHGAYRARTCDPLLVRQMLSQLS